MQVRVKDFKELSVSDYQKLLFLRVAVFVVEQNCPYQEVDDIDKSATHLWLEEEHVPVAYARIYEERGQVHFGRVLVNKKWRHQGLAKRLLEEVLQWIAENRPGRVIEIGAQAYLHDFYASFGFEQTSDIYLEDGIKHIQMQKQP